MKKILSFISSPFFVVTLVHLFVLLLVLFSL